MSISSTRRISSNSSTSTRVNKNYFATDNYSQHVENIDTSNNVLVKDENNHERNNREKPSKQNDDQAINYKLSTPDIINSVEVIAGTISPEEQNNSYYQNNNVNIYTNNQSIVHDKDVELTGRSYLKHFYEKNEHIVDVDELA